MINIPEIATALARVATFNPIPPSLSARIAATAGRILRRETEVRQMLRKHGPICWIPR